MSDALITIIAVGVIAAIQSLITAWTSRKAAAQNADIIAAAAILTSQLDKTDKKVDVIETKLDENHKQMNGNLDKLVKTTAELATAKEKAKNKEENKK